MITQTRLLELLRYAPDTGIFTWRVRTSNRVNVGDVAGTVRKDGYVVLRIDKALMLAHRLAFLHMTGKWPEAEVDHINGVRSDNRWCNLRDVPPRQNKENMRSARAGNKSLLLGVTQARGKYASQIQVAGKHIHLGYFSCPQAAHEAYLIAKRELHAGCTI